MVAIPVPVGAVAWALRAGADRIERVGWWDGTDPEPGGNRDCAVLAIDSIGCDVATLRAACSTLARWVGVDRRGGCAVQAIYDWNDAQDDMEVVVAAMRAAAAHALRAA